MTPNPPKRMKLSAFNGAGAGAGGGGGAASANPSPSANMSPSIAALPNFPLDDSELDQQAAGEEKKLMAQKLYNQWRFLQDQHEEEEKMKSWLEAQGRGYDVHLRPPSPATSMSRQTSRTSSVVGGGDGEDEHLQTSRKRKSKGGTRGGRTGPLAKVAAAKAAYMRVSKKTCDECRRRKVTCSPAPGHYSLDEEEAAYQAWKAQQNIPQLQETSSSSPDIPHHQTFLTGFQKWMPNPGQHTQPTDLLGIGFGNGQLPPSPSEGYSRYEDPENLLSRPQLNVALSPSANAFPSSSSSSSSSRQSRPAIPPLTSSSAYNVRPGFDFRLESVSPSSPSELPERDIPIGRELQDPAAAWQCQYGSEGTHSGTSLTSGSSDICQQVFSDVNSLRTHYTWHHSFFGEYENPYLSKCLQCGWYDSSPPPRDCVNCDTRNTSWEKWYRGWMAGSPSLPSEHGIAVSKHLSQFQSSPAGPSSSLQPPGKGNNIGGSGSSSNSNHSVYQFFGNGGGGGGGRTYQNTTMLSLGSCCCCPMRSLLGSGMTRAELGETSIPSNRNNNGNSNSRRAADEDNEKGYVSHHDIAKELVAVSSSWTHHQRGLSVFGLPSRLSILILVLVLLVQLLPMPGLPWLPQVGLLDRGATTWEPTVEAVVVVPTEVPPKDSRGGGGCRSTVLQREPKKHHDHHPHHHVGTHGQRHRHDAQKSGSQTAAIINRSNHSCRRQQRAWTY